jgi:hypothetical protein
MPLIAGGFGFGFISHLEPNMGPVVHVWDTIRDSALVDEAVPRSPVLFRHAVDHSFDPELLDYTWRGPRWNLTDVFVPPVPSKRPAKWVGTFVPVYEVGLRRTSAMDVGLTQKKPTQRDIAVAHFKRWNSSVIADNRAWRAKTGKGATLIEMKHKGAFVTMKQIAQWEALKTAIRESGIGELQDRGVLAARFLESSKNSHEALGEIIALHKLTKAIAFMEEPEVDDDGRPIKKKPATSSRSAALEVREYAKGAFSLSFTDYETRAVNKAIQSLGHEPSGHFWGAVAKALLKEHPAAAKAIRFDCEAGMFSASSKKRAPLELLVGLLKEPMAKPAVLKKLLKQIGVVAD